MDAKQAQHKDQQLRRKVRNKCRRNGDPAGLLKPAVMSYGEADKNGERSKIKGDMLLILTKRAEAKFGKLKQLNRLLDTGTPEQKAAARRAKKAMLVFIYGSAAVNTDDTLKKDKGIRESKYGMASATRSATAAYTLNQLKQG